jgi:hypothetical protein
MKKKRHNTKSDKRRKDRGPNGQLLPGHGVKSPGNPYFNKLAEYRNLVATAVSAEDLVRVLDKLKRLALKGDMHAIRELLNRTMGKARPADPELAEVAIPEMASSADTVKAANAILAAVRSGKLSTDDAAKLGGLVDLARRSIETNELANRLTKLEQENSNAP